MMDPKHKYYIRAIPNNRWQFINAMLFVFLLSLMPIFAKPSDNKGTFERLSTTKLDSAVLVGIDSLKKYTRLGDNLQTANWYYNLGNITRKIGIYPLSSAFLSMSRHVYKQMNLNDSLMKVNLNLGSLELYAGNYESAMNYYYSTVKNVQTPAMSANLYKIYSGLSTFYKFIGDSAMVDFYLHRADSIFRERKDLSNLNNLLLLEAKVAITKNNPVLAKKLLDSSLEYVIKNGDNSLKAVVHQSFGEYFMHNSQIDSAVGYFNKSIEYARLSGDSLVIADNLTYIAYTYFLNRDYKNAVKFDQEALWIRSRVYALIPSLSSMINIARNYFLMGDYQNSVAYLDSSLYLRQNLVQKNLTAEAYKLYYENYKKIGKNEEALHYLELYYQTKENPFKNKEILHAVKLNQRLEDQREINSHIIKSLEFQKRVILIVSVSIVIILVILIFLSKLYRDKNKQNIELDYQKDRLTETLAQLEESREELSVLNENLESLVSKRTDELTEEIEQRKKAEEELKHSSAQIQKALEREMELNHLKSSIINSISHEFRTPLTVINTSVELLNYFDKSTDETNYNRQIHKIKEAINLLIKLCDGISGFEEVNLKKHDQPFAEFELTGILKEVVDDCLRNEFKDRKIKLIINEESKIVIYSDAEMLYKVLKSVVINALDFSPKESEVSILVTLNFNNKAVVEITDNGYGIPEFELNKVFEPFYRGSNAVGHSGLGLGLSTVKDYCRMLGINYELESIIDLGSTFRFYIPAIVDLNGNIPLQNLNGNN